MPSQRRQFLREMGAGFVSLPLLSAWPAAASAAGSGPSADASGEASVGEGPNAEAPANAGADAPVDDASTAASQLRTRPPARRAPPSRKLALVTTAYYYLSHAYHIGGRFLHGYLHDGRFHFPDWGLAGMSVMQRGPGDLSGEISARHNVPLFDAPAGALTLGTGRLAVDGVLLIGEHGDFPYNEKAQKLYPRYELFQEIVKVFEQSGRSVPVFCDKHLYYDQPGAEAMVAAARRLGFPLMAGSSLPVTWRRPEMELPLGTAMSEALVAARGELEIFGIHALEALQCMVERRFPAGSTARQGVKSVAYLEGDAVWQAGDDGLWSWELLEHALGRSDSLNVGDIRDNCRQFRRPAGRPTFATGPVAFLIEYLDGLRATVLLLNGHVDDTTFAARLREQPEPVSTLFYLPPPPGASFLGALSVKIEEFLNAGRPPYPVERTLLTGGILDAVLQSRVTNHARLETPRLDISYAPPADSGYLRGSWKSPAGGQA